MNKFFKILFSIFFVLLFETSVSNSEETKIKIRNIRKNIRNVIKSDDSYTEDEKNKIYTRIDAQTSEYTTKVDNLTTIKEKELSNV